VWTTQPPSTGQLRREGYHIAAFADLRTQVMRPARKAGLERTSLANPGQALLDLFSENARVAVIGVPTTQVEDLHDVYGYLVEPAYRRGCMLLIGADADIADLDAGNYTEPGFDYA
jgi:hypothetical protein